MAQIDVENLGTVNVNSLNCAKVSGGYQPSQAAADQNKLILKSENSGSDTSISLNSNTINLSLPTNDNTTNISFTNSDGDILLGVTAGPLNNTPVTTLGVGAGQTTPGAGVVALGAGAGTNNPGAGAVSVGAGAGATNQSSNSIAIGYLAGATDQKTGSVAIGSNAGSDTQGTTSVSIGYNAGVTTQGDQSVAIGNESGNNDQGNLCVAVGNNSGKVSQKDDCVSIGNNSGQESQSTRSVAIGSNAGTNVQGQESIAIGYNSGVGTTGITDQGDYSVSIGSETKHKGTYGVSLGYKAGNQANLADSANAFYIGMDGYSNPSTLGQSCMKAEVTVTEDASNHWRLLALNTTNGEVRFITKITTQLTPSATIKPVYINTTTGEIGHGP